MITLYLDDLNVSLPISKIFTQIVIKHILILSFMCGPDVYYKVCEHMNRKFGTIVPLK